MQGWNGNSLSGCIFEPPRTETAIVSFAATQPALSDASLPKTVDLRRHCSPVEDQGRINSCTANAAVGALEYHYARRDGTAPDLSRMFVYYNTRRLKGTVQQDGGARISEAMAAVLAFGACRSELWPYDPQRISMQPPQQAYLDGLGHEALQYARVPGLEGAVRALATNLPVVFGCALPQRCYDEAAKTGRIPATRPDERRNPPSFGHAMLLVGYDLAAKEFLVRNSWGTTWGDGGYCRLPFEEVAVFAPRDAFWTLMSVEPRAELTVRSPARSTDAPAEPLHTAHTSFGGAATDATTEATTRATTRATTGSETSGSLAADLRAQIRGEMDTLRADILKGRERLRASQPTGPRSAAADADVGATPTWTATSAPSDGPLTAKCYNCQGTGKCYQCRGTGTNMGYPCSPCSYSGDCFYCSGSGET